MALDKLVDSTQLDGALEATADAIREKTGSESPIVWDMSTGFADEISNISGSSGQNAQGYSDDDRVLFFDDLSENPEPIFGYTAAEFLNLTEMPPNPDHTNYKVPMRSCGWNTTLAEAKAYVQQYGALMIGQSYEPADGLTHLVINITKTYELSIQVYVSGNALGYSIDWGDNSQETNLTNDTGPYSHQYASIGEYIITVKRPVINKYIEYSYDTPAEYCESDELDPEENALYYNFVNQDSWMYVNQTWCRVDLGIGLGYISSGESATAAHYLLTEAYISALDSFPEIGHAVNLKTITIPPLRDDLMLEGDEDYYLGYYRPSSGLALYYNYSLRGITFPGKHSLASETFLARKNADGTGKLYNLVYMSFPTCAYTYNWAYVNALTANMCSDFKSLKYITFPSSFIDVTSGDPYICEDDESIQAGMNSIGTLEIAVVPVCHIYSQSGTKLPTGFFQATHIRDHIVGSDIQEIGESAFRECNNLKRIVVPNSVTYINKYAFSYCPSLEEIVLPNNITGIPGGMCYNDTNLKYIELPATISSIGNSAFYGCEYVTIKILRSNSRVTLSSTTGTIASTATILVPNNLLASYKSANYWKNIADRIFGY